MWSLNYKGRLLNCQIKHEVLRVDCIYGPLKQVLTIFIDNTICLSTRQDVSQIFNNNIYSANTFLKAHLVTILNSCRCGEMANAVDSKSAELRLLSVQVRPPAYQNLNF